MNAGDKFLGTYEGKGAWYDSSGKSSGYRVRQTNTALTDGFEIAFKHDFDDGSSSTNAEGNYIAWTENVRRVS